VHLHKVTHDRKSKTKPAVHSGESTIGLSKTVEDIGQKLAVDAFTVVANCYASA
jgi:hypothetical protein